MVKIDHDRQLSGERQKVVQREGGLVVLDREQTPRLRREACEGAAEHVDTGASRSGMDVDVGAARVPAAGKAKPTHHVDVILDLVDAVGEACSLAVARTQNCPGCIESRTPPSRASSPHRTKPCSISSRIAGSR